jgi:hypothetical protein
MEAILGWMDELKGALELRIGFAWLMR